MENNKKKPVIAYVVALIMGLHFLYKGVKLSSIGDSMTVFGVLLVICGVVLIGASIFMLCKKPTKKNE